MNIHKNARLTPAGRGLMLERVAAGESPGQVAASLRISVRTVYKWQARQRAEGGGGASRPLLPAAPESRAGSRGLSGRAIPAGRVPLAIPNGDRSTLGPRRAEGVDGGCCCRYIYSSRWAGNIPTPAPCPGP